MVVPVPAAIVPLDEFPAFKFKVIGAVVDPGGFAPLPLLLAWDGTFGRN